jgi:hypothetical protein
VLQETAVGNAYSVKLPADKPRVIEAGRFSGLTAKTGTVWLTTTGGQDVFIFAGQSQQLPRSGKIVIEALFGNAHVTLYAEASRPGGFRLIAKFIRAIFAPPGSARSEIA